MHRGGKIIGTAAMLSVAACGGEQGKLQIRPINAPLASGAKAVPFRIAEARGQFALGNIGLALEAYRMALRDDPDSVDAMTGIAACYDQMARFDLSRRHYEAALAIAPGDPQLLAAFAASLDLQGHVAEAASVRREINQRIAAAAANAAPIPVPAPAPVAAARALAPQRLAAAKPRAAPRPARPVAAPRAAAAAQPIAPPRVAAGAPARPVQAAPVKSVRKAAVPVVPAAPRAVAQAPVVGRSVTIALPPPRPAAEPRPVKPAVEVVAALAPTRSQAASVARSWQPPVEPMVTVALPPARPVPTAPATSAAAEPPVLAPVQAVRAEPVMPAPKAAVEPSILIARAERDVAKAGASPRTGPRLERMSPREIALVTVPAPQWRPVTVGQTRRSATVRFVPLRQAATRVAGVRLLNAARVNRLAARTRSYLNGRGWRMVSIGNAATVRRHSVILYPPERRRTAQRLSAQFGFTLVQRPGARQITVLLGRDAARLSPLRARG
jgi:hypothetical protein